MPRSGPPNYANITILIIIHLLAVGGLAYIVLHGVNRAEVIFSFTAYLLGGFGITALYHRSWTHHAVQYVSPLEAFLAICSVFTLQGQGTEWVANHIRHHQHTDNEDDPHNILEGFWWAHQNWVFFRRAKELPRLPERLTSNRIFMAQGRYYVLLSFSLNVLLPAYVSWASGAPWWGGILLSALRLLVCNHLIYAINSLCHLFGAQPYSTRDTSRNVWWYPFTLGEQYHNYHHTFPRDYRNGIRWFDFDPTKWLIWSAHKLHLASPPHQTTPEKIHLARSTARNPS